MRTFGTFSSQKLLRNIVSVLIFAITAFGILFSLQTSPMAMSWIWASPKELSSAFGLSDSGSYLRLAMDLRDFRIEPENNWILSLWPPGMPALLFVLLSIPLPITPLIALVVAFFWTVPTYFFLDFFSKEKGLPYILIWVLFWHANPVFWNWLLSEGVFNSEPLGLALSATSCVLLIKLSMTKGSHLKRDLVLAGITAAASLYFRPTLLFPFASAACLFVIWFLAKNAQTKRSLFFSTKNLVNQALPFLLPFIAITAPWTFIVLTIIHPGNPSWVSNDYLWGQRWMTSEYLNSIGGQFLVEGGANWACLLDPVICRELEPMAILQRSDDFDELRRLSFEAAMRNPLAFLELRLGNLSRAWMTLPGNTIGSSSNAATVISSSILILLLVASIIKKSFSKGNYLFAAAALSQVAILIFAHTETRYLLPIHETLVVWVTFLLLQGSLSRKIEK